MQGDLYLVLMSYEPCRVRRWNPARLGPPPQQAELIASCCCPEGYLEDQAPALSSGLHL